jgi:hypothetical protein
MVLQVTEVLAAVSLLICDASAKRRHRQNHTRFNRCNGTSEMWVIERFAGRILINSARTRLRQQGRGDARHREDHP